MDFIDGLYPDDAVLTLSSDPSEQWSDVKSPYEPAQSG